MSLLSVEILRFDMADLGEPRISFVCTITSIVYERHKDWLHSSVQPDMKHLGPTVVLEQPAPAG